MFKVFTPFKNAWLKTYQDTHFYFAEPPKMFEPIEWQPNELLDSDGSSEKWPVDDTLSHVCARFIEEKQQPIKTSVISQALKALGLSPYLALGIVSVQQLLALIQQRHPDVLRGNKSNLFCWVNELI